MGSCCKCPDQLKWRYRIFSRECFHDDLGLYNTYGIQMVEPRYEEIINDVSVCEETVSKIAAALNLYQVFPCHVRDVVEDLIV